jgi:hypothetical protein
MMIVAQEIRGDEKRREWVMSQKEMGEKRRKRFSHYEIFWTLTHSL